jgi:cation diffusion facilitator family transporter
MHETSLLPWQHDHSFGQDLAKPGERRTQVVIALTASMMVLEVAAGISYGSMALLGDGLHMASHTVALGVSAFAYAYARRHARDQRFSFGTGKVNALAGFSGALLLGVFAIFMAWESVHRFLNPVPIIFNQAILVAVIGLAVNAMSVLILGVHDHDEDEDADSRHHHDHNLWSAYLHVMADALTSALAIAALLAAKFWGATWMDSLMGVVGAVLVSQWSVGLLRQSGRVLLDVEGPRQIRESIQTAIEACDDNRIADLHIWSIAPGQYTAIVSIVTHQPRSPQYYKDLLSTVGLAHPVVEVHQCPGPDGSHDAKPKHAGVKPAATGSRLH